MYAKNLVQLEREGHIIRKELGVREQIFLKVKSIYATYLLNYQVTSRNVKTILMDAYQRVQKIRIESGENNARSKWNATQGWRQGHNSWCDYRLSSTTGLCDVTVDLLPMRGDGDMRQCWTGHLRSRIG